jgi:hypothetical protein
MYAEVLRRMIPAEFSYEHPLNELDFIVKHPKLTQEVFGEKISLDSGQRGMEGEKPTVVAELPGIMMTPPKEKINEDHKHKNAKRPQLTLRTKLDLYEKLEKDTAKEVAIISVPSSASDSDESLNAADSDNSSRPSSRPGMAPKRSFTRKITRFLGTIRVSSQTSRDDLTTHQTPKSEDIPSPLMHKFGKDFWSTSDTNLSVPKRLRTRLRWRASDEPVKNSFSMLRGGRQLGFWVRGTLRKRDSQGTGKSELCRCRRNICSWLDLSSGDNDYDVDHSFKDWDSASHIFPELSANCLVELPDNHAEKPISSKTLRKFTAMKGDWSEDMVTQPSVEDNEPKPPQNVNLRRPKLRVKISDNNEKQGDLPLVAHYPQKKPPSPTLKIRESSEAQPTPPLAHGSPPSPTAPAQTKILAQVLYDFNGNDFNQLDFKESGVIEIVLKGNEGESSKAKNEGNAEVYRMVAC